MGMGDWEAEALHQLPQVAVCQLAELFRSMGANERWPAGLMVVIMV